MRFWQLPTVCCMWLLLIGPAVAGLTDGGPSPGPCPPKLTECSRSEAWVTEQIGLGLQADLSRHCDDSISAAGEERCGRLRPRFIRELIASTVTDDKAAPNGITLRHAVICEFKPVDPLAMVPPKIDKRICDDVYSLKGDVVSNIETLAEALDLRDLRAKAAIDLRGNVFMCDVWLGGSYLEQGLNLDEAVIDGTVDANHLRAAAGITLYSAVIRGDFEADGLRSDGSVTLFQSTIFGRFHMRGAIIAGDLDLGDLIVQGPPPANYQTETPRGSIGTPRSGVDLSNARIGRQLYMRGAVVSRSDVDLSGIVVDGSIWMETGTRFPWRLTMERAHVGDSVLLGDGQFNQVDMTGVNIAHDLRMETNGVPTTWIETQGRFKRDATGATTILDHSKWLVLRGAKVGAVRDTLSAWPDCVLMTGFTYERAPHAHVVTQPAYSWCRRIEADQKQTNCKDTPPAHDNEPRYETCEIETTELSWFAWIRDMLDWTQPSWPYLSHGTVDEAKAIRPVVWWRNWLERDPEMSMESYTQLDSSLTALGEGGIADDIRFEQRLVDRAGQGWVKFIVGYMEEILIGFGIGKYALLALFWSVLLTGLAAWRLHRRLKTLRRHEAARDKSVVWCWLASVQTLLPFITLSKQMDDFLHTPIVAHHPDTLPLRGSLAIGFSLLALAGLVLGGFLLNGLRSYVGL